MSNHQSAIHMVMGAEEAHTIGAGLVLLVEKIKFDMDHLSDESDKDRNEFMAMLSVSFCAESMLSNLSDLLGIDMGDSDE